MYFFTSFLFVLLVLPGLSNAIPVILGHHGKAKVYTPSPPGQGRCAEVNNATDYVVAVSGFWLMPGNPGGNPLCGDKVDITHRITFQTVTAKLFDACMECAGGDIRLSQAAFDEIGDWSHGGVINVAWQGIDRLI
ncbi:hypothetical protein BC835DRAFT_1419551 [Cytidiella melzeri]|nr:hypothetical protein BC835DRAFT_1419551 [Cytidiella melzeri]